LPSPLFPGRRSSLLGVAIEFVEEQNQTCGRVLTGEIAVEDATRGEKVFRNTEGLGEHLKASLDGERRGRRLDEDHHGLRLALKHGHDLAQEDALAHSSSAQDGRTTAFQQDFDGLFDLCAWDLVGGIVALPVVGIYRSLQLAVSIPRHLSRSLLTDQPDPGFDYRLRRISDKVSVTQTGSVGDKISTKIGLAFEETSMAPSEDGKDEVIQQEEGCGLGCGLVLVAMVVLLLVLNPFTMPIGMGLIVVMVIGTLLQRRGKRKKAREESSKPEDS